MARLLSAYRMRRDNRCYSKGLTPGDGTCEISQIDAWLDEQLQELEDDPAHLCFFNGGMVRPCAALLHSP